MMYRRRFLLVALSLLLSFTLLPRMAIAQTASTPTWVDAMDGSTEPLLIEQSPDESLYTYLYEEGMYKMQAHATDFSGDLYSYISVGELVNSRTSINVAIENDQTGKYAFVGCRSGDDGDGYALEVQFATGEAILWSLLEGDYQKLAEATVADLITPGFVFNTIAIDCYENLITGEINGEVVLAGFDSTFGSGFSYIGGGVRGDYPSELFLVFDELAVTDYDLAGTQAGSSTTAPLTTGTALQPGLDGAIAWAQENPPTAGPFDASAEMFDGDIKTLSAETSVSSFYAELGFVTPANVPPGFWTAGFCFWLLPAEACLEVSIGVSSSATRWLIGENLANDGGYELLESGDLSGLDLTPGAQNILAVYVNGQTGELVLMANSYTPAATFTLPRLGTGDVAAILTFGADAEGETRSFTLETFGFSVWDLSAATATGSSVAAAVQPAATTAPAVSSAPGSALFDQLKAQALAQQPAAGPLNAILLQSATTFPWAPAGVSLLDVFVSAGFVNPSDVSAPWDIGLSIRYTEANTDARLILESTGTWYQTIGPGDPIASGQVPSFVAAPGAVNTIELGASGNKGVFAVNGQVVAEIDLSVSPVAGEVFASSGFYPRNVIEGRQVAVQSLTVWSLGAQAGPSPTTAAVVLQPTVSVPDPLALFNQQKTAAMSQAAVAGPFSGTFTQSAVTFPFALANVALFDSYSTVTFLNPTDVSVPWNVGVGVRFGASSTETRFILESTGMWQIALGGGAATATGHLGNVNAAVGGSNTIEIVAYQNTGVVVVNGVVATQLDLSGSVETGDIFIGSGFLGTGIVEGRQIPYQNFQVWSLGAAAQPVATTTGTGIGNPAVRIAGPLSGSISEDASTLFVTYAEVLLADFYATASFTVPADVSAPWDIIFGFRSEPVNDSDEYRFVVSSDGTWRLTYGLNQPPIATGTVTNLATTPGQVNVLEITVSGVTGSARLNGVDLVTTLDLSRSQVASDVWIGTASTNVTTLPGRVTQYAAFEVWTLA